MATELTIPEGYVHLIVPKYVADRYFRNTMWDEVAEPTIGEVSQYLGISVDKIKKDLKNINCPLRKSQKSKSGRGNQTKFFKHTVEEYKNWIKK